MVMYYLVSENHADYQCSPRDAADITCTVLFYELGIHAAVRIFVLVISATVLQP